HALFGGITRRPLLGANFQRRIKTTTLRLGKSDHRLQCSLTSVDSEIAAINDKLFRLSLALPEYQFVCIYWPGHADFCQVGGYFLVSVIGDTDIQVGQILRVHDSEPFALWK